jgi:epoxide hydrolase-like predicted phosphatase
MTPRLCLYLTTPCCHCFHLQKSLLQLKKSIPSITKHSNLKSGYTTGNIRKAKVRMDQVSPQQPIRVVFFDVMDTLVKDPFHQGMHKVFGFQSFEEFVNATDSQTWLDFELGKLNEEQVAQNFFKSAGLATQFDWKLLKEFLWNHYVWMEGVEFVLKALQEGQETVQLHVLSNYPPLYKMIEEKLQISKYVKWSFVSCDIGLRKPDWKIFQFAVETLGVSPQCCLFVDDRKVNCDAAKQLGFHTIHFQDSQKLKKQLTTYFQWLN